MDNDYLNYILTLNGMKDKTYKQSLIDDMAEDYNEANENQISKFRLLINTVEAKTITINGKETKALVDYRRIKEPMLNALVREVWTELGLMKNGDYIVYDNETYLIRAKTEPQFDYETSYMQICNQSLKFKDKNNKLHEIPCIVENSYPNNNDNPNNNVSWDTSRIYCLVGYSKRDEINLIKDYEDNPTRFILGDKPWKTKNVDKASRMLGKQHGVYLVILQQDVINTLKDDLKNEIAYNEWKDDDVEPVEPDKPTEPDTKPEEKVMSIIGSDSIFFKKKKEYSIENNDKNLEFTWSIDNTELATIDNVTNGVCTVLANLQKKRGYVNLSATNGDIVLTKKIRIKDVLDG